VFHKHVDINFLRQSIFLLWSNLIVFENFWLVNVCVLVSYVCLVLIMCMCYCISMYACIPPHRAALQTDLRLILKSNQGKNMQ